MNLGAERIIIEGSDNGTEELETFLATNGTALEEWVDAGGRLIMNAAPNEGDGLSFDGHYFNWTDAGTGYAEATDPAHTIFKGPYTPVVDSYYGDAFAHAVIEGPGITPLLTDLSQPVRVVLGEYRSGNGITLLGTMTMPSFHTPITEAPSTEAYNLRANIVHYTANVPLGPSDDTTAPKVDAVNPAEGKTGVARGTNLRATFSEQMDPASISKSTFRLFRCPSATSTNCTTQVTNATVAPSEDGLSATLDPYGASPTKLGAKTKYKAVVTTGAKDVAGNALDQNSATAGNQQKAWYFTTGSM